MNKFKDFVKIAFVCLAPLLASSRNQIFAQESKLTLEGHTGRVSAITFSPDGKMLASASMDGTAILWDVSSGKAIRKLIGHSSYVLALDFSRDGKTLVTGGGDPGWVRTDISPAGVKTTQKEASGEYKLWKIPSGQEFKSGSFEGCTLVRLGSLDDGVFVAAGSDGSVRRIDSTTGEKAGRIKRPLWSDQGQIGFSINGNTIYTTEHRGVLRILDKARSKEWACQHGSQITSLAASSDGCLVASATNKVKLWNVATGQEVAAFAGFNGYVFSLSFSPDGKILATGGEVHGLGRSLGGEIKLWDISSKRELWSVTSHKDLVSCLAFSPDGRILASGSDDNTVKLWRLPGFEK
jgi:WD40 repeat protein